MKDRINILGVNISNSSYEEITNLIFENICRKELFTIHNVNVNILLTYTRDDNFKEILDSFKMLFSDGTGVYLASKLLYGKKGLDKRIMGTDLYYYILKLADEKNLKCYFFGGSREAAEQLHVTLKNKYPDIQITGIKSRETEFRKETVEEILASKSDILFVGLGTPYQEDWISEYGSSIDIPIQIAVGSGIEFISGVKKRAPDFLRKTGLEWLYRIYLEPGRLWKRYVFGIPIFMFKIFVLKVKLLINK